jgi:hypothetical protein
LEAGIVDRGAVRRRAGVDILQTASGDDRAVGGATASDILVAAEDDQRAVGGVDFRPAY